MEGDKLDRTQRRRLNNQSWLCGVATLTPLDMAASKLLANSDRWRDDGVWQKIRALGRVLPGGITG